MSVPSGRHADEIRADYSVRYPEQLGRWASVCQSFAVDLQKLVERSPDRNHAVLAESLISRVRFWLRGLNDAEADRDALRAELERLREAGDRLALELDDYVGVFIPSRDERIREALAGWREAREQAAPEGAAGNSQAREGTTSARGW